MMFTIACPFAFHYIRPKSYAAAPGSGLSAALDPSLRSLALKLRG